MCCASYLAEYNKVNVQDTRQGFNTRRTVWHKLQKGFILCCANAAPQDSRRSQAIDLLQKPVGQFPFHILQAITPAIQLYSQYEVNKPSTHVVLSLWHLKVIPRSWLTPGPNRKRLLIASRGHRGPNLPFTSFMRKKSWHIFGNVHYIPLICHKASRRFKINQAKLEVTFDEKFDEGSWRTGQHCIQFDLIRTTDIG